MKRLQLVCLAVLISFLTSCGLAAQQPPTQAVRLAVTQQLAHTQQTIAQELGFTDQPVLKPNFKIDKLDIQSRTPVSAPISQQQGYPSAIYKVQGTVSTTLTSSEGKIQQSSPFEVYLGNNPKTKGTTSESNRSETNSSGSNVETWFLIDPQKMKLIK
jgi:hypothetical protein